MIDRIAGIVLAAGPSTRMGRPKQLLPFGETTLLGWVVRGAEESSLDDVIVVIGPDADELRRAAGGERSRWVVNPDPSAGNVASLLVGAEAAGEVAAVAVMLGDVPGVDADLIDAVVTDWRAHRPPAAVTAYRDGDGHPFVLSAAMVASLAGSSGEKVLWPMLEDEPEGTVRRVRVDRPKPLDVNTWDDYLRACQDFGFEPGEA